MNNGLTSIQLRGRASGAMIFTGFGTVWLGMALYSLGWLHAGTLAALAAGVVLLEALAVRLFRAARRLPQVAGNPAVRRRFNQVNAAQWIVILVAVFAMHRAKLDDYVLNVISAVVGLHMFPLARIFRYRPHYVTGAALSLWAVASVFLAPAASLQAVDAFGTGIILWGSAATTLALQLPVMRQAAATVSPRA